MRAPRALILHALITWPASTPTVHEIEIVVAPITEYPTLVQLYRAWGYGAGIELADRVYVARLGDRSVGLVRRTDEQGSLMLRGMQVDPNHQRQGVGTRLLKAFAAELPARECYCIPFRHLSGFYRQTGFEHDKGVAGPAFLHERLAQYRAEGHDVLLMRRPPSLDRDRAS